MPLASERDRWLALGLLLGVFVLAYLLLVHPWWTAPMLETNDRIASLQQRELRARMQLKQAPAIADALRRAQQLQASSPGFLPEATSELATAGLVQRLETVVAQASPGNRGCAISNRSPQESPSRERFAKVTVQVRMRCGNPELAAVLHALESETPRLFVDNLNILAQGFFFLPGQNRGQGGGLDDSFELYGYLRPVPHAPRQATEVTRAPR
jgi:general secretion pathway protein M